MSNDDLLSKCDVEPEADFWRRKYKEMSPFSGAPLDQIEKRELLHNIKEAERTGAMTTTWEEHDRRIQERYDDFLKRKSRSDQESP